MNQSLKNNSPSSKTTQQKATFFDQGNFFSPAIQKASNPKKNPPKSKLTESSNGLTQLKKNDNKLVPYQFKKTSKQQQNPAQKRTLNNSDGQKIFAPDGGYLGTIPGSRNVIRVLVDDNDVSSFIQNDPIGFNSFPLENCNKTLQSKILTIIYNKAVVATYNLYQNKIFVNGIGLGSFRSDDGNNLLFGQRSDPANSYYSTQRKVGIINMNEVSSEYYDMVKTLDHENNHNLQTINGIDTSTPFNHFDVEYKAFKKYQSKLSKHGTGGYNHAKDLMQGYLHDMSRVLNQMHNNGQRNNPDFLAKYKKYNQQQKRFEKLFGSK